MAKSDNPVKFGWCTTDQHNLCRVEISDGVRCGCDCHQSK